MQTREELKQKYKKQTFISAFEPCTLIPGILIDDTSCFEKSKSVYILAPKSNLFTSTRSPSRRVGFMDTPFMRNWSKQNTGITTARTINTDTPHIVILTTPYTFDLQFFILHRPLKGHFCDLTRITAGK